MAGVVKVTTSVVSPNKVAKPGQVSEEELRRRVKERRSKRKGAKAGQAEVQKDVTSSAGAGDKGGPVAGGDGTGRRVRFDQDERAAIAAGKRKAVEEAHLDVMGAEPTLPAFELGDPPQPPVGLEHLFPAEVECLDIDAIRKQKKEVQLAMHQQEVPIVNAFLHGVKMDLDDVVQIKGTGFSTRADRAFLASAYGLGEVYVTLARAKREVELARCQKEEAKAAVAEAKKALHERNSLQMRTDGLGRELKKARSQLKEAKAELEMSKEELRLPNEELKRSREEVQRYREEVSVANERATRAVEDFKVSEEFSDLVRDGMVDHQLHGRSALQGITLAS